MPLPPAFLIGWRHSRVRTRRSHAAAVVLALLFIPLARAAGTSAAPEPVPAGPADAATTARMRLISQEQYFNSLGYVFGPDITVGGALCAVPAHGRAARERQLKRRRHHRADAGVPAHGELDGRADREPRQPRLPRALHAAQRHTRRSRLRARLPAARRAIAVPSPAGQGAGRPGRRPQRRGGERAA